MPKQNSLLEELLQRFDRLEKQLAPLLQSANSEEEFLPLDKLPFPVSTARKYIYAGILAAFRIGKRLFVKKSDLVVFMERRPRRGRKPKTMCDNNSNAQQKRDMLIANRLVGLE